jgi:hypothetical protein
VTQPLACPANRISHLESEVFPGQKVKQRIVADLKESLFSRGCPAPRCICPRLTLQSVSPLRPPEPQLAKRPGRVPPST